MEWLSGAVGLGGLGLAALTLILSYRSRLSQYQQNLYQRQLEAAMEVLEALGRCHDEAIDFLHGLGSGSPAIALKDHIAGARGDFFRIYRRWNVVVPQPVTAAVTRYLGTLEAIGTKSANQLQEQQGDRLASAYAAVLGAAQRELRIKTLSDTTLGLIESFASQPVEHEAMVDPLYIKAIAEQAMFDTFRDERTSLASAESIVEGSGLGVTRNQIYTRNRNLFLVHVWRPSTAAGQVVDISIRLAEHKRRGEWPKSSQASREQPLSDDLLVRQSRDPI